MTTYEILQKEKERLKLIGSSRDPVLFQAMRQHIQNDSTKNRTIIVNFAHENQPFGCRFTCGFCSWRKRATMMGDICPTTSGIAEFLAGYEGYKVTISGGGDPLYQVESMLSDNCERLQKIVDTIHDLGYIVEVITKEVDTVVRALKTQGTTLPATALIKSIDMWSLSFENTGIAGRLSVETISEHRLVRVSKVCSPGCASGDNIERLQAYVQMFIDAGAYQVILREDFFKSPSDADLVEIKDIVGHHKPTVRYLLNRDCTNNFFLIRNWIYDGDIAGEHSRKSVKRLFKFRGYDNPSANFDDNPEVIFLVDIGSKGPDLEIGKLYSGSVIMYGRNDEEWRAINEPSESYGELPTIEVDLDGSGEDIFIVDAVYFDEVIDI